MVRKQLKDVNPKLKDSSSKMDKIFKDLHTIARDFVKEIDQGIIKEFKSLYVKYDNNLKELGRAIPVIKKEIREFGIY